MALSGSNFCDNCGAANRPQAVYCTVCGKQLHVVSSNTTTGLLAKQHLLRQRYRITGQIGQGGFGAVYRAEDMDFANRPVAIKEMSQSSLSVNELIEATEAFKREAFLLAGLTHPNLPRIYEQFTDTGRRYLVMDYIQGETLDAYLTKIPDGKLPVEQVLHIALQLCTVLDYLHTRQPPIIFRDLKPANIMLTPEKHLYLIDFGIARHFKPGQAKDTTALGSSGYAAPEQYGKTQSTPRSDIYGLGAVLHQLLSGDDPSENPFRFAPLKLGNHPALITLASLIQQMLEMDDNKRPSNISSVKRELERITAQYTGSQTHLLASTLPPGTSSVPPLASPRTKAASQTVTPQPQKNTIFIATGHSSRVTGVAWSPKGTLIASAGYDKKVRVWDAITGASILIYRGHAERVYTLAWSPDGSLIASAGADKTVQVWEARTGKQVFTYTGHSDVVHAVAWLPVTATALSNRTTRIASAGADKTVQVWEMAPGGRVFTYRGHSDEVLTLCWSPDGKRIVSGGGTNDKTVQIWDPWREPNLFNTLFSNRTHTTYHGHRERVNAVSWSHDGRRIATASSDRSIHVWDTGNGKLLYVHRNPTSSIHSITWSPDNKHLASGGNDKMVHLLDTYNRTVVFTYQGHTNYVTSVDWSPDGTRIVSAGIDRTVQVWQVK